MKQHDALGVLLGTSKDMVGRTVTAFSTGGVITLVYDYGKAGEYSATAVLADVVADIDGYLWTPFAEFAEAATAAADEAATAAADEATTAAADEANAGKCSTS